MRWVRRSLVIGLTLCALGAPAAHASVATVAPTPPMGWSSWYRFYCATNEALVKRTAKAMASDGMKALGYRYLVVDDCWMSAKRTSSGALQADPKKFPDGISSLAAYVHSLGLKLGLYLDAGPATCAGFPGSAGHFAKDIDTLASWGVDYVKVDYCRARPAPADPIYTKIATAIAATHRSIVLNVCDWGYQQPWLWAPGIASTWRTSGDYFSYGAPQNFWAAMLKVVDLDAPLANFSQPGAFNDPNNLLVGTGYLTASEERAQISLWSILAAPLVAGGDLSTISKQTLATLTNRQVVAVDQDRAGLQGTRIVNARDHQVWVRHLADGDDAVVVLNTTKVTGGFPMNLAKIGLPAARSYQVHDLWQNRTWRAAGPMVVHVAPRDVRMFRVGS